MAIRSVPTATTTTFPAGGSESLAPATAQDTDNLKELAKYYGNMPDVTGMRAAAATPDSYHPPRLFHELQAAGAAITANPINTEPYDGPPQTYDQLRAAAASCLKAKQPTPGGRIANGRNGSNY